MAWAPDYITPEELAHYLRVDDQLDDDELADAVAGASRAVDRSTFRQFGKTDAPEARVFTPTWSYKRGAWVVECDDFHTVPTSVAVDTARDGTYSTSVDPVAFGVLLPANAAQEGRPWERLTLRAGSGVTLYGLDGEVRVTTVWGWSAVPPGVVTATKLQAARLHARRSAPFGIAGSPDSGSELRLLARVDPDVAVMLGDYRRRGVG